ncbi:lytic polysaccharide monooxygenase [Paenibacillus sp. 481]|nr:lytic polysaccharide monooxygenase [Paenibacillus sp. 481]
MWNTFSINVSSLLAACFMTLLTLTCWAMFTESASAHGYIESPASRSLQCKQGSNTNCGRVVFDPHSVEGRGSFPQSGPADGKIAGGGVFSELDEQSLDRWSKVTINGGTNTFKWHLTAAHATREWKYYITKAGWDPNQPLTRATLDLEPFCYINDGGKRPSNSVSHSCNVPTDRSGYHLILGVWEIADTANAFYQVIDVNLVNGSGGQAPTIPQQLVSRSQTTTSIGLAWAASTSSIGLKGYEIYRDGRVVGTTNQTSYSDTMLTPNTAYTYTVRAIDGAGNKSSSSAPITVKTIAGEGGGNVPAWNANTTYVQGKRVQYNGLVYEARWWTRGDTPGRSDVWKVVR